MIALVLLAVLGLLVFGATFSVARRSLPARPAMAAAVLMTLAGGLAAFAVLMIEVLIVDDSLKGAGRILGLFLVGLAGGLVAAFGVLRLFTRRYDARARRSAVEQFD
jgi:uncharacterized membrane protein required for colicin V production